MTDTIIKVENLSKKFCRTLKRSMYYGTIDTARSMFSIPYQTDELRKDEFWALRNISFELKKGEKLGIIGANGSGKSTLLRLLNGIFPPDEGKITVDGRIGALIAVGAGFHPHMTGRENIYLNGTILGMPKEEIKAKFDQIVEFTELHEFLDAPVSNYSSGMKVKLGFGIAVHSQADILLVDEVLSVGDIGFRNKSLRYMSEMMNRANGLIYISHNLDQVQYLCDRALLMDKGRIVFEGNTEDCIREYEKLIFVESKKSNEYNPVAGLNKGITIKEVMVNELLANGNDAIINQDDPIIVEFTVNLEKDFDNCTPIMAMGDDAGTPILNVYGNEHTLKKLDYTRGVHRFKFALPALFLKEGKYLIHFTFRNVKTFETHERQTNAGAFFVKGGKNRQRAEFLLAPNATCSVA